MEENMEQKPSMFHDPLALKATEKSLYDVIGEKYPDSPNQPPPYFNQNIESPDRLLVVPVSRVLTAILTTPLILNGLLILKNTNHQYKVIPPDIFLLHRPLRSGHLAL